MTLKRLLLPTLLLLPVLAPANTPFDGEWTLQPQLSQLPPDPEEYSLAAGQYRCATCVPLVQIPADGAEHAVTGAAGFDSLAVRAVNSRTVRIEQHQAGQTVREETYAVAPDDNTLTLTFTSRRAEKPLVGSIAFERVGAAVPKAHLLSGTWRATRLVDLGVGSRLSIASIDNGLRLTAGDGRTVDALFDLKDHPVSGAGGFASVTLARLNPLTVQINHKQRGAIIDVVRAAVSSDGRQLTVIRVDRRRNRTFTLVYHKGSPTDSSDATAQTP